MEPTLVDILPFIWWGIALAAIIWITDDSTPWS